MKRKSKTKETIEVIQVIFLIDWFTVVHVKNVYLNFLSKNDRYICMN